MCYTIDDLKGDLNNIESINILNEENVKKIISEFIYIKNEKPRS